MALDWFDQMRIEKILEESKDPNITPERKKELDKEYEYIVGTNERIHKSVWNPMTPNSD